MRVGLGVIFSTVDVIARIEAHQAPARCGMRRVGMVVARSYHRGIISPAACHFVVVGVIACFIK